MCEKWSEELNPIKGQREDRKAPHPMSSLNSVEIPSDKARDLRNKHNKTRGLKPQGKSDPERLGGRLRAGLGAWGDMSNAGESIVFVLLQEGSEVTDRSGSHISRLSFDAAQIWGTSISQRSLPSALWKSSPRDTQMGILRSF